MCCAEWTESSVPTITVISLKARERLVDNKRADAALATSALSTISL